MAAALSSNDLTEFLIENSGYVNTLSLKEKREIKVAQPTPVLDMQMKDRGKFNRRFQTTWYTTFNWLTGSIVRNRLFCFYCILFSHKNDIDWCRSGVGAESLKNITSKMRKHESSPHHICSAVKFTQMGTARIDPAQRGAERLAAIRHNENVDRNRLIVKRLISTTCFLARQELAFRGHDNSQSSLNKGNYLELLDFLAEEESYMKTHLIHSAIFNATSPKSQNEMIECITKVVNELILNEIEKSHFVSIQVDETTDVSTENKISVIARYANVSNGEIEERFLGFYDVPEKTSQALADVLLRVLNEWKIEPNKLLCQTYDGASTMTRSTEGVHTIIKQQYSRALFIHSYSHDIDLVLLHGSKTINEVKIFIANLAAFRNFFSSSSKRMALLVKRGFKLPSSDDTGWNFHSRGVTTILANFSELKAVVQDVLENDGWDSNTISLAINLQASLDDIKFVFLLHLYNKIFEYTSVLRDVLQTEDSDVHRYSAKVENCLYCIKRLRKKQVLQTCIEDTEALLSKTIKMEVDIEEHLVKEEEGTDSVKSDNRLIQMRVEEEGTDSVKFDNRLLIQMRVLAFEILDNVVENMESRFKELQNVNFLEMLNEKTFKFFSAPQNFPDKIVENLVIYYPFFDKLKLKGELMFIYSSEGKALPPNELFKFLITNNLKDVLPEIIKLLSLILCFPLTATSCERNASTLKRIKTFLCNNMTNERLSNLATLAIEKGLVKTSASQQEFISRTIDVFAEKSWRSELVYKTI